MRWRTAAFAVLVLASLVPVTPPHAVAAPTLPDGFADSAVASVSLPVALAVLPTGELLVASLSGQVSLVDPSDPIPSAELVLDLGSRVCNGPRERGLQGIAADPAFATNRRFYLFYTHPKFPCERFGRSQTPVNRVSRFVLPATGTVDPATEVVLLDGIPSVDGIHHGGALKFGPDGNLYVSSGDSGCSFADASVCGVRNPNSRPLDLPFGKLFRIRPDGGIPSDNPFVGASGAHRCLDPVAGPAFGGGGVCSEIYATGLRNPFRMAFSPSTGDLFINDVGSDAWEEVNRAAPGADYGWNLREGRCVAGSTTDCPPPPAGLTDPIHAYPYSSGCHSITGGAFVTGGDWPEAYRGDYLFADYVCGKMFILDTGTQPVGVTQFGSGFATKGIVDLVFGNDGSAYYAVLPGEIRRISYSAAGNRPPTVALEANPSSGDAPIDIAFDANAADPDGDPLTLLWDFGDGTTLETTDATVEHRYAANGSYVASVQARDNGGLLSSVSTVSLALGNDPPEPVITSPAEGARFATNQTVTLRGNATDTEDVTIPGTSLTWEVTLHHDTHTHPFLAKTTGAQVTFTAPAPESLGAVQNSWLEIALTAVDSAGGRTTVTRRFDPIVTTASFTSQPNGARVRVNELALAAPANVPVWQGMRLAIGVDDQRIGGIAFTFLGWSDGGARNHTVTVPASGAAWQATLKPTLTYAARTNCFGLTPTIVGTGGADVLRGTESRDVIDGLAGNDTITALGGDDVVCGGGGKESIDLGDGSDIAAGQGGADRITGGTGYDYGYGGAGANTCATVEYRTSCTAV